MQNHHNITPLRATDHAVRHQVDRVEHVLDTIRGIVQILEEDMVRDACEGPPSVFTDFHRGTLLTCINEVAARGYDELQSIDRELAGSKGGRS